MRALDGLSVKDSCCSLLGVRILMATAAARKVESNAAHDSCKVTDLTVESHVVT